MPRERIGKLTEGLRKNTLDGVMRKARELEGTHEDEARELAKKLKDATKDLAPEEPGWP